MKMTIEVFLLQAVLLASVVYQNSTDKSLLPSATFKTYFSKEGISDALAAVPPLPKGGLRGICLWVPHIGCTIVLNEFESRLLAD
jgi:hypothetical protein